MKWLLIVAVIALPAWTAAQAQDDSNLRIRAGLGAQAQPKYPGADSSRIGPLFQLSIAKGNEPFRFKAPDDGLSLPLVSSHGFALGVVGNYVGSRKDKDVGVPLGKVKATIEAGVFARYFLTDSLRVRAQVRKGLNGHKGVVGQVGLDQIWRDGDKYVFSVGSRLMFGDDRYERAYFGVTPEAALRTGLPVYHPGSGITGVGAVSGLNYQLGSRLGMFGYAGYERLVGDAAKSPVVRQLGSRNQLSGGVGLTYIFNVKR